jgi:Uma2 family endonuclease
MMEKVSKSHVVQSGVADYAAAANRLHAKENQNGRTKPGRALDRWHNLLVSNVAISFGSRLKGSKNELYIGNMEVQTRQKFSCFPDVVVVSGEPKFADQNSDLLLNPTVVVEICTSGTSSADKTELLENFLATESIKECFFIKQDEMRIEHYSKQNAKQWIYRIYNERDDVDSADSINTKVSLSEIYGQIKLGQDLLNSRAVN